MNERTSVNVKNNGKVKFFVILCARRSWTYHPRDDFKLKNGDFYWEQYGNKSHLSAAVIWTDSVVRESLVPLGTQCFIHRPRSQLIRLQN